MDNRNEVLLERGVKVFTDERFDSLNTTGQICVHPSSVCRCGFRTGGHHAFARYALLDNRTLNGVVSVLDFQSESKDVDGWTDEQLIMVLLDRMQSANIGGSRAEPRFYHDTIRGLELAQKSLEHDRASQRATLVEQRQRASENAGDKDRDPSGLE